MFSYGYEYDDDSWLYEEDSSIFFNTYPSDIAYITMNISLYLNETIEFRTINLTVVQLYKGWYNYTDSEILMMHMNPSGTQWKINFYLNFLLFANRNISVYELERMLVEAMNKSLASYLVENLETRDKGFVLLIATSLSLFLFFILITICNQIIFR
ncbi:hypothetical protein RF11_08016 [Thelohanellus kitauei]|uniref:Uncharacterized protein n=1 Tax=Thelohanellus kitauei TaxID=669202 RepID=A0A0C2IAY6_THEKT|nr:hypothetical protein RF11_08016 [Thelohanellus kitauei]